uniref:5-azacytidine-induced protein 2-like n=1 Tax=Oncorhynchus gorbuscha TaxID=8017 RepID=UPI001EAEB161
ESPVSVCAGDESVASHFALVTAYEDIKKRLRDTERENTLLRKRVKQLEDKLFRPEAPSKREKSESERLLNEQLQAKEMELLQLKTEMETSQGDRINSDLKMATPAGGVEMMTLEKNRLQGHCG